MSSLRTTCFLSLAVVLACASESVAQTVFESVGERALGMGGAFVAVANDSTATFWNPAGLVAGGPGTASLGWTRFQSSKPDAIPVAGLNRQKGTSTSVGSWPVGFSYGHFEQSTLEQGAGGGNLTAETLHTSYAGITVLQSLVQGLVGGVTVRYVRGDVVRAVTSDATADAAFGRTDDMEGHRTGTLDMDIGLMADMEKVRVGVTCRNLRSPKFGDPTAGTITLPRETRLGVAVLPTNGLTLAMDLDLDTVDLRGDLRRELALGGEGRVGRHLQVRTGLRWDLKGDRRLLGSAGVSVSVRRGLWLDGHYAAGRRVEDREYGVALRAGL